MPNAYSLQRRLAWRLGLILVVATAAVTFGLYISSEEAAQTDGLPDAALEAFAHALLREYFGDVFWMLIVFVGITMLVGYLTLARAFQSVSAVSHQAAAIQPPASGVRLPTTGMPSELTPLIAAVNDAFNRLEEGFTTQRRFMTDAAHQLRTPLAALSARLDDLLADVPVETSTAVRSDLRRITRLVNQLLKIARFAMQPLEMTSGDLRAVGQETVTFLAPLAIKRGLTLSLSAPSEPVSYYGNAGALGDALANIVENALEHAPKGTDVEVAVSADGTVRVLDRGPGVAPDQRAHAFERFWRADQRKYEGAGLGLAIVAEVVQLHRGRVWIEDRPGAGAVVAMAIPSAAAT